MKPTDLKDLRLVKKSLEPSPAPTPTASPASPTSQSDKAKLHMNKRQKMQVTLGILFVVLLIVWIILPGEIYTRILGVISSALGILSMVLSYRAEEKNKTKHDK